MLTLLLLVIAFALVFEFINGFHDTANSIATVVATKVLSPGQVLKREEDLPVAPLALPLDSSLAGPDESFPACTIDRPDLSGLDHRRPPRG